MSEKGYFDLVVAKETIEFYPVVIPDR